MSLPYIRQALAVALDAMTPALTTVWPNDPADNAPAAPYQRVDLMMAQPRNDELGSNAMKSGVFQITLCYPLGENTAALDAQADAIETTFYRGLTLTQGAQDVIIERTPHILPGYRDANLWCVPVQIRFVSYDPYPRPTWLDLSSVGNSQLLAILVEAYQ